MKVVIHPTRAGRITGAFENPVGTTSFWTWAQIEGALRVTNGIRENEKLAGIVIEDRGVTLCLETK